MTEPTTSAAHPLRWVPIRSLSSQHRERIYEHLLALGERDRYLRFGYPAQDAQIAGYVEHIDFVGDEVFGIFNRRLELVAMAHLAFLRGDGPRTGAEFGVSVLQQARGRGLGARLFERAVLHARNRGVDTLVIHALTENAAMLRIARNGGAQVQMDGPDATAYLKLPPVDFASRFEEMLQQQAAEFDYGFKVQALQMGTWLGLMHLRPPETREPARAGRPGDGSAG